jgi:glycosyltransferase involved in cell wall biosynthesis
MHSQVTRRKILYVITKSNWGGAQRYVYDLATTLPEAEFDVSVAFGGTGGAGEDAGHLDRLLKEKHIRTIFIPEMGRDISVRDDWHAFQTLLRIFKTEQPDIIHLNSSKVGGLGSVAGRIAGIKNIVFTSHGLAWDEDRGLFARISIWLATWGTFLLCTSVIVISKDNYRRARTLPFCRRKIRLVYNGLRALEFLNRTESREALALGGSSPIRGADIVTLGELTRNKGLRYLVAAARILRQKNIEFSLTVIGEGEDRPLLQKAIKEHQLQDCVRLAGFLPDGYRYLKAFDIYVSASVKEGLPYVLLEAAQASLAVVASKIPGNTDIVDEGVSGLLFQPKNAAQLAVKLELLIKNKELRKKLAENLHKKVTAEFSLAHMLRETEMLYPTA